MTTMNPVPTQFSKTMRTTVAVLNNGFQPEDQITLLRSVSHEATIARHRTRASKNFQDRVPFPFPYEDAALKQQTFESMTSKGHAHSSPSHVTTTVTTPSFAPITYHANSQTPSPHESIVRRSATFFAERFNGSVISTKWFIFKNLGLPGTLHSKCSLDILFVVDSSGSVGEIYEKQKVR